MADSVEFHLEDLVKVDWAGDGDTRLVITEDVKPYDIGSPLIDATTMTDHMDIELRKDKIEVDQNAKVEEQQNDEQLELHHAKENEMERTGDDVINVTPDDVPDIDGEDEDIIEKHVTRVIENVKESESLSELPKASRILLLTGTPYPNIVNRFTPDFTVHTPTTLPVNAKPEVTIHLTDFNALFQSVMSGTLHALAAYSPKFLVICTNTQKNDVRGVSRLLCLSGVEYVKGGRGGVWTVDEIKGWTAEDLARAAELEGVCDPRSKTKQILRLGMIMGMSLLVGLFLSALVSLSMCGVNDTGRAASKGVEKAGMSSAVGAENTRVKELEASAVMSVIKVIDDHMEMHGGAVKSAWKSQDADPQSTGSVPSPVEDSTIESSAISVGIETFAVTAPEPTEGPQPTPSLESMLDSLETPLVDIDDIPTGESLALPSSTPAITNPCEPIPTQEPVAGKRDSNELILMTVEETVAPEASPTPTAIPDPDAITAMSTQLSTTFLQMVEKIVARWHRGVNRLHTIIETARDYQYGETLKENVKRVAETVHAKKEALMKVVDELWRSV